MIQKPNMIEMPAHPTNTWSRLGTKFLYIVMHYVGAVSTAKNNGSYYGGTPNIGASAHFFVDQYDIVSSVPLTLAAGHCGVDYSNGTAPYWRGKGTYSTNRQSIGIEMCCKRTASGEWYIEPETVEKSIGLVRWLMQEYGIDADHVIRHYDVCHKNCPAPWVEHPEQWAYFKRRISEEEIDMTKEQLDQYVTEKAVEVLQGVGTHPSAWAEKEMGENLKNVQHITDGTRPQGYTKREECAAMVDRAEKRSEKRIADLEAEIKALKEGK